MYVYMYVYIYVCVCVCVHTHTHIHTHTHNGVLLGNQKEWNLAIYSNMDGTRVYYAKWNKSENDRCHMTSLICGI